jgi:hypothetical protein
VGLRLTGRVLSLGIALSCHPGSQPVGLAAPAGGSVVAVPLNPAATVPPPCRQPYVDGAPCTGVGPALPLTAAQASTLAVILADPTTWGGDEAKCTLPFHGFAWLDSEGRPTQQVAVSFLCQKVEAEPSLSGQPGSPSDRGLSASGEAALRALCVDVGLPDCGIRDPDDVFGR